jgi:predicted hotdog family 3-hydroxylacyl-ACP dehydratase
MTLPPIESLLPHVGRAILIDRLVEERGDVLVTEVLIRADHPYLMDGRVGAWVGVELIAQSAAARAGLEAVRGGGAVRIGFLLGTRRFRSTVPWYSLGDRLLIEVEREFGAENGLGAARGRILSASGTLLSEAVIIVFQPPESKG